MSETAPVSIDVAPLVPIAGRGDVRFLASVTLLLDGVEMRLDGFLIREDKQHRLRVSLPAYRNPRSGLWEPAVKMPLDLERAVGQAILEMVPAGTLIRLPVPDDEPATG